MDFTDAMTKLASPSLDDVRETTREIGYDLVRFDADAVHAIRVRLERIDEEQADPIVRAYRLAVADLLTAFGVAMEPHLRRQEAERLLGEKPQLRPILRALAEQPLTVAELAERLDSTSSTTSRALDALRAAGLVERFPGADHRQRPHRLTMLGSDLLDPSATAPSADPLEPLAKAEATVDKVADMIEVLRASLGRARASVAERAAPYGDTLQPEPPAGKRR